MTFLTHSMNLTTAWKHQSMLLTPVTTQKETFIAVATKRKTPQNMKGLQAWHRHAASPRTCFFLVSAPMSMLGHAISSHIGSKSTRIVQSHLFGLWLFLPTLGQNRNSSIRWAEWFFARCAKTFRITAENSVEEVIHFGHKDTEHFDLFDVA